MQLCDFVFRSFQSNLQEAGLGACLLPPHSDKTFPLYNLQDKRQYVYIIFSRCLMLLQCNDHQVKTYRMQQGWAWELCAVDISCMEDPLWNEINSVRIHHCLLMLSVACMYVCFLSHLHPCPGSKPGDSASQPDGRWPAHCPVSLIP